MLTVTTGCSFAMNVAPSDPSKRTVEAARECTGSYAAPIADTLSAGVGAFNTAVALSATDEVAIYGISMKRSSGLALGVTQLAAFGLAATYGYIQGSRCHALRAERHLEEPPEPPPTGGHGAPTANTTDSTNPANASADATDAPGAPAPELPSWSAFRRVELEPPHAHKQATRFESPPP
jgi:hypothetical protein